MSATPSRRAAVLGHPVAHSLSPVLHTAAYRALGLAGWDYGVHDVTEDALAGFLDDTERDPAQAWAGLSLTMPLKQAVIPLLDHVEPLAEAVGAVNTVLFTAVGGVTSTTGTNTDVHGIVAALREGLGAGVAAGPGNRPVAEAVVLGGGATAASALAALAELGCASAQVFVRSLDRIGPLREAVARMGVTPSFEVFDDKATTSALASADAVVSTTPKYAADTWAKLLTDGARGAARDGGAGGGDEGGGSAAPRGVLLDVVYDPRPTALQSAWTALGARAVGGERMLLHQAAEQVRLMTGQVAPLAAMDEALRAALAVPA
ncbi:shikimate dehydrogenase [Promicromonospora sp. MEB111]|uniref:shikimate dehydrogenase n=1 Tax=Promicromonospora sp. MEB111 TaxID=3040301 RepID=UPI00254B1AD1|nr:shikimate dehydrogenase [Promicromonospora sp. MEB111]